VLLVNLVVATCILADICKIYSRADSKTDNMRINQRVRSDCLTIASVEKQ